MVPTSGESWDAVRGAVVEIPASSTNNAELKRKIAVKNMMMILNWNQHLFVVLLMELKYRIYLNIL